MEGIPGVRFREVNHISGIEAEEIDAILDGLELDKFHRTQAERAFKNKEFFEALPKKWKSNPSLVAEYIRNSSLFADIIHEERKRRYSGEVDGLLADNITAEESTLSDGTARRIESGCKVNTEYLHSKGIDPSKVLMYRRTQPEEAHKPELYWTSDFGEVLSGLTAEIYGDRRNNSIVLVADLDSLDKLGGGLIQDVNDDNGLSVRMIRPEKIDQSAVLFSVKNPELYVHAGDN